MLPTPMLKTTPQVCQEPQTHGLESQSQHQTQWLAACRSEARNVTSLLQWQVWQVIQSGKQPRHLV